MDNNEKLSEAVKNIDAKLTRLVVFAEKKNLCEDEKQNFISQEFEKSCKLYGISEDEYFNHNVKK